MNCEIRQNLTINRDPGLVEAVNEARINNPVFPHCRVQPLNPECADRPLSDLAVAGCVLVLLVDVTPVLGPGYTLLAFVIVIVGGLGSMPGALLGGVLIGLSEALAGLFIAPSAKSMMSFGLLILVLLLRPQGLLGRKS